MKPLSVSKSKFKPQVLEYLRQVQSTGKELIITDRGRPVLKIVRYAEKPTDLLKMLRGTVLKYQAPAKPVEVDWRALS